MDAEIVPIFHLVVKPSLQSFKQSPQPSSSIQQSTDNVNVTTPLPATSAPPPPQPFPFEHNNLNVPAYPSVLPGGYQIVAIK